MHHNLNLHIRTLAYPFIAFLALASVVLPRPVAASEKITAATGVGFSTFNPVLAPPPSMDYLRPVYDSLVRKLGLDRYEPGLAKSFSYDRSAKAFHLELRESLYFSDGTPLNASAVKANFEYGRSVKRSPWASFYANIAAIETPRADEVILRLKSADPTLLESLQSMPGMMVSPAALANPKQLAIHPVGVGPWKLDPDRSIIGERHTYIRNSDYWDPSVQQLDPYIILHIPDAAARVNALRGGQVDIAAIGAEQAGVVASYGYRIVAPGAIFQVLQIADARGEVIPALGDVRVRRAIRLAMDREAILQILFSNYGAARNNFYPAGVLGHSAKLAQLDLYDLARARELIRAAGHADGFAVEIVVQPQSARVAAVVAGELAKIGIRLDITIMPDSGSWLAAYRQRQSPVGILAHRMVPPHGLWRSFVDSSGHYNPFKLEWPDMDRRARRAAQADEGEGAQRRKAYAALVEHMVDGEAIVFPIAVVDLVAAMRPGIAGDVATYSEAGLPNPRFLLLK